MSDFFSRYESELRRALRAVDMGATAASRSGRSRYRRRTPLLVGIVLVLIAVPAVAAVTGAFKDDPVAPGNLRPGQGTPLSKQCTGPGGPPKSITVTGPAPAEMVKYFGVLGREKRPSDALASKFYPRSSGIYVDAIRKTYEASSGARYYLVPVQNVRGIPQVPNTEACRALHRLQARKASGVCVVAVNRARLNGPGDCATLSGLRRSSVALSQGFDARMAPGTMMVSGLAVDGVRQLILRYRDRGGMADVRVGVHGNVISKVVDGRPERLPAIYSESRDGVKLLVPGPQPESARQRGLNRRSARRDLTAGTVPRVVPAVGRRRTTFTMRVRVEPMKGYVYVVQATGPPGPCREALKPFAYSPDRVGPTKGLIKAAIGYGPLGLSKMCLGSYHGEVRRVPEEAPISTGEVIGRFKFLVRPG